MVEDGMLHGALLELCRQNLDDDAPRLVWADAVGGERGELVVLQCDLARGTLAPAQAAVRRRRERELLTQYGRAWAGLDTFRCGFEFRRGFIEAIKIDASLFVDCRDAILLRAPFLRSVTLTGLNIQRAYLQRALESVMRVQPHNLDLFGSISFFHHLDYSGEPFTNDVLQVLVESGALGQLRALGISESQLSPIGLRCLVSSGELHRLERLWLHQRFEDEIFAVLFRASQVASFDEALADVARMGVPGTGRFDLRMLPQVTELHLSGIHANALVNLGNSRAAATIETLRLSGELPGFVAFPRLHTLDFKGNGRSLGGVQLDTRGAKRGVDALPSLRRLRIPYRESESVLPVARTWGAQLEELTLWGWPTPDVLEQAQKYVAGEVLGRDPYAAADQLL